jgi:hypothetical protein
MRLLKNQKSFELEKLDPRLYIYEVFGIGYSKTWVHSSLKQYIEVRPWLLSVLSLSILKPKYIRNTLVHIPGGACPSLVVNKEEQDNYISNLIKAQSFVSTSHLVALKENDTYYEIIKSIDNKITMKEIPFLNDNYYIAVSLLVSSAIVFYSAYMILKRFLSSVKLFNSEQYVKSIEQRQFAVTKKSMAVDVSFDKNRAHSKVLELNLFNATPK